MVRKHIAIVSLNIFLTNSLKLPDPLNTACAK